MLILRRKSGESIVIGEHINVTVLDINEGSVRLAIDAPKVIPILRSELLQAANLNRDAASAERSTSRGLLALMGKSDESGAVKPVRPGASRRRAVPETEPTPEPQAVPLSPAPSESATEPQDDAPSEPAQ